MYDFVTYNPGKISSPSTLPIVRLRAGTIAFNKLAYNAMKNPVFITCHYDKNLKVFGFQPCGVEHPLKVTVSGKQNLANPKNKRSDTSIVAKSIYKAFELDINELLNPELPVILLTAKWDDDLKMLIADLKPFLASRNGGAFSPIVAELTPTTTVEETSIKQKRHRYVPGEAKRPPGRPPKNPKP